MPRRSVDERTEARLPAVPGFALLEFRGAKHPVQLINLSGTGAMIIFPHLPNIGERLALQLLDGRAVSAQVRWAKDGRIGLSFARPLE